MVQFGFGRKVKAEIPNLTLGTRVAHVLMMNTDSRTHSGREPTFLIYAQMPCSQAVPFEYTARP